MKIGIFKIIIILLLNLIPFCNFAQNKDSYQYERNSLCMMMIAHPNYEFNKEIEYVFSNLEMPERFNDHNVGVHVVQFTENGKSQHLNIISFCKQVDLAKRFVAKWFNRDKVSGGFNMELIKSRGNYNATIYDVNLAKNQARDIAILEDAGENLISQTFLVMNDITYVNKEEKMRHTRDIVKISSYAAQTTASAFGDNIGASTIDNLSFLTSNILENIKGFKVNIKSYLFKLKWNDDIANMFFDLMYTETPNIDTFKVNAFKKTNMFSLEYIGYVENTSSSTSLYGVRTNEDIIKKVCSRTLDKNLADLQHKYYDFRIKAPLVSVSPLKAYVGMKEDINENSRYEVLEKQTDEKQHTYYKRIGIIKPIKNKIWDNRFMASYEKSNACSLKATEFTQISGGKLLPGMLIREIE